jgi:hypothetical protein
MSSGKCCPFLSVRGLERERFLSLCKKSTPTRKDCTEILNGTGGTNLRFFPFTYIYSVRDPIGHLISNTEQSTLQDEAGRQAGRN